MGTSIGAALTVAALALSGCATERPAGGVRGPTPTADQHVSWAIAFVTSQSNLVGLTPRTAPSRMRSLLTLSEIERNEVEWIFEGAPRTKGSLQTARLVFSPGEAKDEVESIVLSFDGHEAKNRARLLDEMERMLTFKLGAPRVREGSSSARRPLRGWALGTDWQVTLKTGTATASEIVELSVGVQHEP